MSTSPPSPPAPYSQETESASSNSDVCLVCGDQASIINYGARSCLSCRTFFRRNAYHKKEGPPCRFTGDCEINKNTRKVCAACRLAKCLLVGMSPDLIRKEDLSAAKRKANISDTRDGLIRRRVMPQLERGLYSHLLGILQPIPSATTVNLHVSNDASSSLTDSEQKTISNVFHAFDIFSPVSEIRQSIETITTSASSLEFDTSRSLHFLSLFYQSLLSFISSTPDFNVLTSPEQVSLFQRNMLGVLTLGGMYLMRECRIFDQPENGLAMSPLYGDEIFQRFKAVANQLDTDPIVIRLLLVALAFSSNCSAIQTPSTDEPDSLLLGTFRLFGSQNVYAELIWKYLVVTYGSQESVRRLSRLINSLLGTLTLANDIYDSNSVFQQFITDRLQQLEQSVNVKLETFTPLWGKQ